MPRTPTILAAEIADRYTIERELGRGATAVVYLARDRAADRRVALKVLRPELAESLSADRFLREIRVTQQLSHPHIAPVLDSGVVGDQFYCVLDYMDGGTLRTRLDRERQLPMPEVAAIARAIGAALEFAHAHRIIHRDVKPENILFGGGQACLADFGIARALESAGGPTTSTGVVRGTPAYMSPEQASGEREYDGRSDVYSLACVLYEAIAGMPAFVGPNAQAVLAQRLIHVPRPLHVYRPAITAELEAVMGRALAIAPADRYQTATKFTEALCSAIEAPGSTPAVAAGRIVVDTRTQSARQRGWMWAAGLAVTALVATVLGPFHGRVPWASPPTLDTTRIAVFPVQAAAADEDLLVRGIERWHGVTLADQRAIAEALQRRDQGITRRSAATIAASVGSGRYVLGRVDSTAAGKTVYAALYDVHRGELYHAELAWDSGPAGALTIYAALADSLLLRGQLDDAPDAFEPGSRDLPGTQLMIAGQRAVQQWNLIAADTLFARAARSDTTSGRPLLWLAQVREWAGELRPQWASIAQAALAKRTSLSPAEQIMADGLAALAGRRYLAACVSYRALTDNTPKKFAGYYGLGDCHAKDRIVVADRHSPSGWRFRSSYQQALTAYVAAFKLLPATYRGFQADGFAPLKELLFLGANQQMQGESEGVDQKDFYAFPIRAGDTIALIPVPAGASLGGQSAVTVAQIGAAVIRLRELFDTITSSWALSAPSSAGAKEAKAIALELMGDPAAVDSLARTQSLATDPLQRLRLAATRAYVQLKVSAPDDPAGLTRARRLADSLLSAPHGSSVEEADVLGVMAALTGRCRAAAGYLGVATRALQVPVEIPRYVVAAADSILAYVAMGCQVPASLPSLDWLAAHIQTPGVPDSVVAGVENAVMGRIVRARFGQDSAWVGKLASTADFLLTAENDFLHGRRVVARDRLRRIARNRLGALAGALTADAALAEAQLWLALADTAGAVSALRGSLDYLRNYPPMDWDVPSQNILIVGSLVRAMQLRATLAADDRAAARRWSAAVALLWVAADPEVQPMVRQMRALSAP